MFADKAGYLAEVIGEGARCHGFHFGLGSLPAERLVEVKAELAQECRLQPLQPQVEMRGLHGLLGLTAEQVFPGLALAFEHLTPGLQFGMGAMEVQKRRQEMPL